MGLILYLLYRTAAKTVERTIFQVYLTAASLVTRQVLQAQLKRIVILDRCMTIPKWRQTHPFVQTFFHSWTLVVYYNVMVLTQ